MQLVLNLLLSPLALLLTTARAFSFTNTVPGQCDDLTVTWDGGQPPFRLLIIPPGQPARNISIPDSSFKNNQGSFTTQLMLAQHQRVMFSISDATGFTAGGITTLLVVGPGSGRQCNTTSPRPDFFFSLDNDLEECKLYPFTLYSGAVQPITIIGFIPGDKSFVLTPPIGDQYVWQNNLAAGTPVSFMMHDSRGRDGGTADVRVVSLSDDKSCLDTPLDSPPLAPPSRNVPTAALVGAVIGGMVFVACVGLLAFWFWRRRNKKNPVSQGKNGDSYALLGPGATAPMGLSNEYQITPFQPGNQQGNEYTFTTRPASPHQFGIAPFPMGSSSNAAASKMRESMASHYSDGSFYTGPAGSSGLQSQSTTPQPSPNRPGQTFTDEFSSRHRPVIVHQDITEAEEQPLELPPQYSAERAPIPGLMPSAYHQEDTEHDGSEDTSRTSTRQLPPLPEPPRKS